MEIFNAITNFQQFASISTNKIECLLVHVNDSDYYVKISVRLTSERDHDNLQFDPVNEQREGATSPYLFM